MCSLFHVVVETDDISTKIIRYLTAEKGGRVTFIPLNRVKVAHITYPQSSDVVPLLKKLKFRSDYAPAFSQVVHLSSLQKLMYILPHVFFLMHTASACIKFHGASVFSGVMYMSSF